MKAQNYIQDFIRNLYGFLLCLQSSLVTGVVALPQKRTARRSRNRKGPSHRINPKHSEVCQTAWSEEAISFFAPFAPFGGNETAVFRLKAAGMVSPRWFPPGKNGANEVNSVTDTVIVAADLINSVTELAAIKQAN